MRYIILTAIALIAGTTFAQVEQPRRNLELGITGGLNMSSLDVQPQIRQTNLNGLNSGLFVRYTSEKYFSMICAAQLEVNFSQRGWEEEFDKGVPYTYSRTLNYLEVPFFAHLSWGKEQRGLQFFINLGPQFGILLSDKEEYGGGLEPSERPETVRPIYRKEIDKKFEYGIAGGAGFELKTKIGNLFVEGRYYYGLSDIFNNSKIDDFGRSANKTITVKLGYSIRIL